MDSYLTSALNTIYGKSDDFLIFGLTGQTGSGCSTVAKILQQDKEDVKHSLFYGDNPETNQQRKERIIRKHFLSTWQPFICIKVSSILTLFLLQSELTNLERFLENQGLKTKEVEKIANLKNKLNADKHTVNKREFNTNTLIEITKSIKESIPPHKFTSLYQEIGSNIRKSGSATESEFIENKFFSIAEEINHIIKDIKEEIKNDEKIINKRAYFVIDAIRNPLEALFFQERYSSFYLLSVSCPDDIRKRRLRKLGYDDTEIATIDTKEYSEKKLNLKDTYTDQDIKACLQRADLYINNEEEDSPVLEFKNLANQIIKFVCLARKPGLVTPTAIERCMQVAYTAKLNSGCISRQVGAIVTDQNYSIKSVGWNDTPHGQVPCNLRSRFELAKGNDINAYSSFEKHNHEFIDFIDKGNVKFKKLNDAEYSIPFCFKSEYNELRDKDNQVHTRSLHAEENAFLQISKYGGIGVENGFLFTTASPCELCAKKAYQLGITKIYYIDPYPGISMEHILISGGKDPELILFHGAIGRAFHKLYAPISPYKDELKALSS